MAKGNSQSVLEKAKKAKDDEYYTMYEDISAEVPLYKEQLKGKRILCPCDWDESYNEEIVFKAENHVVKTTLFSESGTIKQIDIEQSKKKIEKDLNSIKCNFVKFLVAHADDYGIKSISVSGYNPRTNEGIRFQDVEYSHYDLVITNPPFSQFRELIDILSKNAVEFLVIGPQTAIGYKNVSLLIRQNKLWLGYAKQLYGFGRPDGTRLLSKNPEGSVPRACKWYTNLDVSYRHDKLILTEEYIVEKYPFYKEFGGIRPIYITETKNIPYNYDSEMGVPFTFLQKYNPEQFEIVDIWNGAELFLENGKRTYGRIIIKKR
jgi:hypothetical protein